MPTARPFLELASKAEYSCRVPSNTERSGLKSESKGQDPMRRIVIYLAATLLEIVDAGFGSCFLEPPSHSRQKGNKDIGQALRDGARAQYVTNRQTPRVCT